MIQKNLTKILLIVGLVLGYQMYGDQLLAKYNPQVKKNAEKVLGIGTNYVAKQASHSAEIVKGFVFKKASQPLVDQINKLPKDQKEEIKKQICK
ncbi:MAG: hypothetical protein AAB966_02660 [Patescibacteria group bacterium]